MSQHTIIHVRTQHVSRSTLACLAPTTQQGALCSQTACCVMPPKHESLYCPSGSGFIVGPAVSEQNPVNGSLSRCTLRGQSMATHTCCDQPTDVCHVRQQPGVVLVCNLAHARVVVVASVGRGPSHNQLGAVQSCIGL